MGFWNDVGNAISDAADAVTGAVSSAANTVVDAVTTAVGAVVTTLESTVGILVDAIGFVVGLVFSVPVLGRFLNELLDLVYTVLYFILSLGDFVLTLIGVTFEKRMKLCVIIQRDEKGNPITDSSAVDPYVQFAINAYKRQANIRVLPDALFVYASAFDGPPHASDAYIDVDSGNSSSTTLDVRCEGVVWARDLTTSGSAFNWMMIRDCFWGNGRRLLGYGAPIAAIAVRKFTDGDEGCALGWAADYVTVDFSGDSSTLAHEMGHACNLWHVSDPSNLMIHQAPHPAKLTRFQAAMVRASRHVTFF